MRILKAWPGIRRAAAAVGLGAAIALGQAPWDMWWLALPALALLVRLLAGQSWGHAAWQGWLAGAGYFAAAMFWIVEPFMVDAARHGWMAPFALVFLAMGMALFWALAGGVGGWLRGPLALAVALAGADLLRGYIFTGFPWALIGHMWIDTPVAQLAAWVGPVGLTLGTVCLAALAARWPRAGAVAAVAAVAGAWTLGAARLSAPEPAPQPITARIIQPNAAQHLKWDPEMARLFFERQLQMTAEDTGTRPDLVIWPETAVNFLLEDQIGLDIIAQAAGGVPVALGIQRVEGRRFYNSLAVIDAGAQVRALYDKHHLVPFGEYMPFGDTMARFGLHGFAAQQGQGYSPGPGAALLDLGPLGRVLPLICYEAVFPQDLNAVAGRADWILQATNDAWFGQLVGPYQHLAQARLRAIEQGLPVLRSANTGVSAVIDARGRILQSLPMDTHGYLQAAVPGALPPTLYSRMGDTPVAVLLVGLLAGLAFTRFRKRG